LERRALKFKQVALLVSLAIMGFIVYQVWTLRQSGSQFGPGEVSRTVWGIGVFFNQEPSAPYNAYTIPIGNLFYIGFTQELIILLGVAFICDLVYVFG